VGAVARGTVRSAARGFAAATPLAMALCLLAGPAFALGPPVLSLAVATSMTPLGIIELRDATARVDVLPFSLAAFESGPADAPHALSFRPDFSRFASPSPDELRGFIPAKAVWLCFTVRSAASSRSWLISAGPNSIDSVNVYVVDPDGRVESLIADSERRSSEAPRPLSEYAFRLTIGPGQVKTIYMRFSSESLLSASASLWDSFYYLRSHERVSLFLGLLLGVVIAVFFSTFFIAISLREGAYTYYLVYLLGLFLLLLAWRGGGNPLRSVGGAWAARRAIPFFSCIMDIGISLFSRRFLDLKRRSPFLSAFLLVYSVCSVFFIGGLALFDLRAITAAGMILDLGLRLVVLAAAITAAFGGGRRRESYFFASWFCVCVGTMLARLGQAGLLAPGLEFIWDKSEGIGYLIQVLLLSYGITGAINTIRTEKEEGQLRSIELLERANKVKEDFVIRTSLEFRSPLFGIVGLADELERSPVLAEGEAGGSPEGEGGDRSEARRLVGLIRAESLRLLGSVANVAAFARLRNGDLVLSIERVSLAQVARDVADQASHMAAGKDLAIETEVENVVMVTDGRILGQIVHNLFSDALKRSPSGLLRLEGGAESSPRASAAGGRVRLAVVDSAPPLPEEQLLRFRSGGGSDKREAVGPGLELLVARLLAERLGGSLTYVWAEGRGRFELDLPRESPGLSTSRSAERSGIPSLFQRGSDRRLPSATADLSETPPGKRARGLVLAYDEDPVFLEALKHYLERRGFAVAPVISVDKAVELATSRRFDLILLDASSQGRPGLDACARIRAQLGMDELPVVVMTDRESAEAVEAAFRAGASDYLPKLSPNELLFARVDTHVSLKRSVEEALETRRRVAELEKLKTLGVLAAGVAHEVNTPNNAVIRNLPVFSEVWRELAPIVKRLMEENEGFSIRGWSSEELMREMPELLADTYNAGLQIKKIVEDLKDYARDSSSSPPEPVDLSAVAAYASRLLQPLVDRSTRRFVLDAPAGLPPVRGNFQKLTQVAVSVLENALQALPNPNAGVTLRTRFEAESGRIALECWDEGPGIPRAILDKVFEPFFTTKRDSGGTGLGLSVALGIVRDAGGEIEVNSLQGEGTRVRIVLPVLSDTEREEDGRRA
jgi:signal transduction histidine kinase